MPTMRVDKTTTVYGKSYKGSVSVDADMGFSIGPKTVAAAKTGTLTTRTDNDTGTLTLQASHGVNTGDKIDIYWSGGKRVNVTVGTVSVNSVPIDLGAGDNLPAATTAVTVCVPVSEDMTVTGNNVTGLSVKADRRCAATFFAGSTLSFTAEVTDAGGDYSYVSGDGQTNPLASAAITSVKFSNADSSAAARVEGAVLYN